VNYKNAKKRFLSGPFATFKGITFTASLHGIVPLLAPWLKDKNVINVRVERRAERQHHAESQHRRGVPRIGD